MSKQRKRTRKSKRKSQADVYGFGIKIVGVLTTAMLVLTLASGSWQFIKNPFLMISVIVSDTPKTFQQTWDSFGKAFESNKTTHLPSTFLAALAQTESSGRQWTSTEWTFDIDRGPLNLLAPVSTSFGLMQFTTPTFSEAKNYCINNTKVESSKPWFMLDGCWFSSLKTRASASNSIETAAAYLQNYINKEANYNKVKFTSRNAQRFAAIAHLCGIGRAKRFIRDTFYIPKGSKCGTHGLRSYVNKVMKHKRTFEKIKSKQVAKLRSTKKLF